MNLQRGLSNWDIDLLPEDVSEAFITRPFRGTGEHVGLFNPDMPFEYGHDRSRAP